MSDQIKLPDGLTLDVLWKAVDEIQYWESGDGDCTATYLAIKLFEIFNHGAEPNKLEKGRPMSDYELEK